MFSRFFYADGGIVNNRGHHTNICRAFVAELASSPFPVHILAHKDVDPGLHDEMNAAAFFAHNPYWTTDGDPVCGWLNAFHAGGQSVFRDLGRINDVGPSDLFYFPSTLPAQFLGIMLWLGTLAPERRPTVVIEFLFPCGLIAKDSPQGKSYELPDLRNDPSPVLLRFAAGRIGQIGGQRLHFGFVDKEGAAAYAPLLDHTTHYLPSPQCAFAPPHSRARPSQEGRNPITVSVLGHQRGAKGYELVPEIARRLFASRPNTRMIVHNSDLGPSAAQDELRALAAGEPRLTIEQRAVSVQEFGELFERTDIMLCPYYPGYYKNGTSGIVAEAVANAIPLVLPAGTTPARMAAEFSDASVAFKTTDVPTIVTALEQVVDRFDVYAESAMAGALQWQRVNGPANMVKAVLGLAQSNS
jgi:hypothetical protein